MTSLEPVKAAIAETRDASTLWTVREILNDWHVGDIDEASDQDVADGRDYSDHLLTEAAWRAVAAMPITDAMVEVGARRICRVRLEGQRSGGYPLDENLILKLIEGVWRDHKNEARACLEAAKAGATGGQ